MEPKINITGLCYSHFQLLFHCIAKYFYIKLLYIRFVIYFAFCFVIYFIFPWAVYTLYNNSYLFQKMFILVKESR